MPLILQKLWRDELGAILAAEYMIIATLLVIGTIVGIKSLRDAVVTELADTAEAVSAFDNGMPTNDIETDIEPTGEGNFEPAQTVADALAENNY